MRLQDRRKSFLFLQGPPGPFFARLGDALRAEGHEVRRINLNGGDRADWPVGAVDYRGSAAEWPRFFDGFVRTHGVTDLILFGDCRPLHRAAHGLAQHRSLGIHVFEEGYIRPDWVTLEAHGVNGNSTLSRDPDWYLQAARHLPPLPTPPPIPSSFGRRAREALSYYTRTTVERWRFPHYRSHRPSSAILEGLGWVRRFATRKGERRRSEAALARLDGARYFVFPLQLDSDHQVRVHSPFGDCRAALDFVVESFARAAPADALLVVKLHPLDAGLVNWRRVTAAAARRFGVGERVAFLEEGDIARLVDGAEGLVTINSTTGTLSIGAGVPTAVLGDAVYDIPRITHQGPLDGFWTAPTPPDPEVWDAYRRVLGDRCLIPGGFLSEEGLDLLVRAALARLSATDAFSVRAGPDRSAASA